jgi:hypothetical protein
MKSFILFAILLFVGLQSIAQQTIKALFIGNSYTYYNNLPQLTANIALSLGDTLTFDSNTIGGYTFEQHSTNTTTITKITAQPWDYVILQEQSQLPSFPPSQVQADVLPFADSLVTMIRDNNSCTKPLFFMTWGRKNGDASNCANYAPVCTYAGMQQRLYDSYLQLGQLNQAEIAPVGVVWRTVRDSFPNIELYDADGSHPNLNGSYLGACTFYASIFHKSPVGASYPNGINATDAANIQRMAHNIVFDSLATWMIDTTTVLANFSIAANDSGLVTFNNSSANAAQYLWHFGDGNTSVDVNPQYQYADSGEYEVMLVAEIACKLADTTLQTITITFPQDTVEIIDTNETGLLAIGSLKSLNISPNPAHGQVRISGFENGNVWLNIYQYNGQRLVSKPLSANGIVDVSGLTNGVYLVEVIDEAGKVNKGKMIVLEQ